MDRVHTIVSELWKIKGARNASRSVRLVFQHTLRRALILSSTLVGKYQASFELFRIHFVSFLACREHY